MCEREGLQTDQPNYEKKVVRGGQASNLFPNIVLLVGLVLKG